MPTWIQNFVRRILGLQDGRYLLILTKQGKQVDWTVLRLGKMERSKEDEEAQTID
jgi:hypothetical protein